MIKNLVLTIFASVSIAAASSQTIDRLDQRNGFKDLVLGSKVNQYPHLSFNRGYEDQEVVPNGSVFTATEDHYKEIGSVKVDVVEALVYDGLILGISVRTPKDPNLLKGLRRAFGKPTQTLGATSFVWRGDKITLDYRSYSKNQLELYYDSKPMRELIKQDKDRKIQDIANDF